MFKVNFCGFNAHEPGYRRINRPDGTTDYLLLLILAPMRFCFQNHEEIAKTGACILCAPGYPHQYSAVKEFANSYVHFTSDNDYLHNYTFPVNELFYPANTHEVNHLIQKILIEYLTKPQHYLVQINAYITQLHVHLERNYLPSKMQPAVSETLSSEFQTLRMQILTHCDDDWSIERMCQTVNLEKSQLYAYYKMFFYNKPKSELINARIEKAKYLLTNEDMKINQVAQASGFTNVYHFTRYFKKICKCTPGEFRNRIKPI